MKKNQMRFKYLFESLLFPAVLSFASLLFADTQSSSQNKKLTSSDSSAVSFSIQSSVYAVKGIPLRMAEKYVSQIFPPSKCGVVRSEHYEKFCEFYPDANSAELKISGASIKKYVFFFKAGELVSVLVLLPRESYFEMLSLITKVYGAPHENQENEAEDLSSGKVETVSTAIWKQGAQRLTVKSHFSTLDTMSINLFAEF